MKRNVDLTKNRFFSNNNSINDVNILDSHISKKCKFPWDFCFKDDDFCDLDQRLNAVVITGNKATRQKINYYRQMNSLDYCDCCGKRMNLKPWNKEVGVCHKCYDSYLKSKDKCRWR